MSQALTLARPYARAAFAIAREGGKFAPWSDALAFSAQVAGDPRVAALLLNPALHQDQAVTLLAPPAAEADYQRFLGLLADAQRLALLPEIAGLYEQLRAEAEHVVKATVTSATDMSPAELDASLIGGAVIDTGEMVIDGSLKGKLARLQNSLAH